MEFFVDIADIGKVERVLEYYPVDGITTNPNILAKSPSDDIPGLIEQYRRLSDERGLTLFFQVTAETAEDMLAQAKTLRAYFGERLIVKLPAVEQGYKALLLCGRAGIPTALTMVHSVMQALVAAKAGAAYVAPYVSHIDNIGADGIREVADMVKVFREGGYPCKVLGASFRTVDQVERLALVGCHAVTLTPEFFPMLIAHPSTNESAAQFKSAWESRFGGSQVTDLLPKA